MTRSKKCEICNAPHKQKLIDVKEMEKLAQKIQQSDCSHQFFEIKKMSTHITNSSYIGKQGVLVQCALCKEERELWEVEGK